MKERALPQPTTIDSADKLKTLAQALAQEPLLAIDTESNSLYAYRERVCLIQLSTRTADFIIDPFDLPDLQPLAPLFANPAIEKVFHAAEYDLMCMKRDFGFIFRNLFDTMIAARVCGRKQIGLGALLSDLAGIPVDKSHQRDDWGRRPIPPDSLLYAQMDTHYLPMLRDYFMQELKHLHRIEEAREAFSDVCLVPPARSEDFNPEGYWRIAQPHHLTRRTSALLRELYIAREHLAQEKDTPPFKIMLDKTLVAVAQAAPTSLGDLAGIDGMSPTLIRRYGRIVIDAVAAGLRAKAPIPPPLDPPADPTVVERYTALREWRKARAMERGVESDVIISKDALWTLAERAPDSLDEMDDVRGLGPWRLGVYGAEILEVIRRYRR
ncbi:MAG: ribonuclease D [Chloroflexi bacterium]|nr:ribonuclease D [Chloroflexota bacterium]